MKLARCSHNEGEPFWAVVDIQQDEVTPIVGPFSEWAPAIAQGKGISALRFLGRPVPLSQVRLLPPIEPVNRVVVAGANYTKHLAEDFGLSAPAQPVALVRFPVDVPHHGLRASHRRQQHAAACRISDRARVRAQWRVAAVLQLSLIHI